MGAVGNLFVRLGIKMDEFSDGLKRAEQQLKSTEKKFSGFTKIGQRIEGLGKSLALGITAPLALAGGAATKFAMDAVESENLFEVSMGGMAMAARLWSTNVSRALGLNQYEVRRNIGTFDVMLKSFGLNEQAAYGMSKGLTQLSYDMASFYNLKPEEAFEKLRSGITGETEPLKALGIVISETAVQTYAWTHGIVKQGEQLNDQQKVLARYGLIMERTKTAQGDLARTMDSPVNQLRKLKAQLEQAAIAFGQLLLPMVSKAVTALNNFASWLNQLSPAGKSFIVTIAALAAALGPLLMGLGSMLTTIGRLPAVLATLANPLSLATVGVGLLVAAIMGIASAYNNTDAAILNHARATRQLAAEKEKETRLLSNAIDRYEKLSSQNKLSASEQEELRKVSRELARVYPDMVEGIDNTTGAIKLNTQALRENVRAQREQQIKALETELAALEKKYESLGKKAQENLLKPLSEIPKNQTMGIDVRGISGPKGDVFFQLQQYSIQIAQIKDQIEKLTQTEGTGSKEAGDDLDSLLAKLRALGINVDGITGKSENAGETTQKILDDLQKNLNAASQSEAALGDQYDESAEKAKAAEGAIQQLINNGLKASDPELQKLIKEWQGYNATVEEGKRQVAIQNVINQTNQALRNGAVAAGIFGTQDAFAQQKVDALRGAIQQLVELGLKPGDPALDALIAGYKAAQTETDNLKNKSLSLKDTLGNALLTVAGSAQQTGKSIVGFFDNMAAASQAALDKMRGAQDSWHGFYLNKKEEEARKEFESSTNKAQAVDQYVAKLRELYSTETLTAAEKEQLQERIAQAYIDSGMKIEDAMSKAGTAVNGLATVQEESSATVKSTLKDSLLSIVSGMEQQVIAAQLAATGIAWGESIPTFGASLVALAAAMPNILAALAGFETVKAGIRGLAEGGLTTGPALRMIGEGRYQEAVLPLNEGVYDRLASGIVSRMGTPALAGAGGPEIHLHIGTLVADELGLKKLERELSQIRISENFRRGEVT